MGDDQNTSGTSVNPATDSHAPRQSNSAMDATSQSASIATPPVVAAPPETDSASDVPPVSDEIAQQIAADSSTPAEPTAAASPEPQAAPPVDAPKPEANVPAEQADSKPNKDQPTPAAVKVPKPHNPARSAIVATVVIMVVLACLTVFAYMSTKK